MNTNPSLRELQQWLKWVITDPRGVAEALNDPSPNIEKYKHRYTSPTNSFLEVIASDKTPATDRLDIYAEGYFSRILDCLSETFSRTKKAVGEDFFTMLAAEYLKAYPSMFNSIDEVGRYFPKFLNEMDDERIPLWIPDIANLEWNWIEAFYAPEVSIDSNWKEILAANPAVRLKVNPSVCFISSQYTLDELLQQLDNDKDVGDFSSGHSRHILIYRVHDEVLWQEMNSNMFQVLKDLSAGVTIEDAMSRCDVNDLELIGQYFGHWVENEIICGILD